MDNESRTKARDVALKLFRRYERKWTKLGFDVVCQCARVAKEYGCHDSVGWDVSIKRSQRCG